MELIHAISLKLFNTGGIAFLIATILYVVYLGTRSKIVGNFASGVTVLGVVVLTIGLGLRWREAGLSHPPFTNLYEILLFFSWGIALVYSIIEFKYKIKVAGAFVLPISLAAMGIASLSPNKDIEPLVPALQSSWLHFHVAVSTVAYAAFIVAFGFSVLFLLKDKVRLEVFGLSVSIIGWFSMIITNTSILTEGVYRMRQMMEQNGKFYPVYQPGTQTPVEITIPGVGKFFLIVFGLYILAMILHIVYLAMKERSISRYALWSLLASFGLQTVALFLFLQQVKAVPEVSLQSNPYEATMFFISWGATIIYLVIYFTYKPFVEALPDKKLLDKLTYKTIMVAFPLMTLVIITGAIWANYAWGTYWSWDPKETWSLITWLVYALYLHARITIGWHGRRTAYISIVGFVVVVFTFLGVNIVLSGLHSYAAG
jgi:ABC-type transport system involved in cytochrome c biogenesis permease subunit